jgi:hypothetical protein
MRLPVTVVRRDVAQLEEELRELRQEVRSLVVLGMRPDLLPDEAAFVRRLEGSARADVNVLLKALQHIREQSPDRAKRAKPQSDHLPL